jgi:hypothetical protein
VQAPRRPCLFALMLLAAIAAIAPRTNAESLTITSTPPGATIEIDGAAIGVTPYTIDYPSSYFHKPHTVFSSRLEHAVILKIHKEGYTSQQITLTDGPLQWISVNGRRHGNYFLLKGDHFDFRLEQVSEASAKTPMPTPGGNRGASSERSGPADEGKSRCGASRCEHGDIYIRSQRRGNLCRREICWANTVNCQHAAGAACRGGQGCGTKKLAA